MIEKNSSSDVVIEGRRAYLKLEIGDSTGQAAIAQGGDFPTPGDPTYDEAQLELSHLAHAIEFDSEEMALLDSQSAAADKVMERKMAKAKDAMERDLVRQCWMDGSGVLARIASVSGTRITLDDTGTVQADHDRFIWLDDSNRAMYDAVHATTGADGVTGFKITLGIDEANNYLHTDSTMTSADADDVIVRSGDWATGGAFRSLEYDGVLAMVADDNTYLNINRSTGSLAFWRSTVDDNSGTLRSLSENLIHGLFHKVARRADSGVQPGVGDDGYRAFANFGPWLSYHNLMSPGLRYTNEKTPDIGWAAPLNLLGVPFYKDVHAPQANIFLLHIPSIKMVKPKHNGFDNLMKFVERGNSIFFQKNASSGQGHAAAVLCYLEGFTGMMTDRPRNHGRLADITGTAEAY